jgi:hypothetical protein
MSIVQEFESEGLAAPAQVKIQLKQLNIITNWNFKQHECTLCRRPLAAPPLQEFNNKQNNKIVISVKASLGACGHMFHKQCIDDAINNGGVVSCSICSTPWKTEKILNTGAMWGNSNTNNFVVKNKTKANSL